MKYILALMLLASPAYAKCTIVTPCERVGDTGKGSVKSQPTSGWGVCKKHGCS